jgi:hypothetical protein
MIDMLRDVRPRPRVMAGALLLALVCSPAWSWAPSIGKAAYITADLRRDRLEPGFHARYLPVGRGMTAEDPSQGPRGRDAVEHVLARLGLVAMIEALSAAGLLDSLRGDEPFTVLAPTDAAFASMSEETRQLIYRDERTLADMLANHLIPGRLTAVQILDRDRVESIRGGSLAVEIMAGARVEGARLLRADVHASNSVIHVVDRVILPH